MTEPRIITLEELVAIDDLPEETLEIPEWGGLAVRIRGLTKGQEAEVRRDAKSDGEFDSEAWELAMVLRCVIDPPLSPEHAALLRGKSAGAIDRVLKRVLALSGLGKEVAEAAKKEFPAGSVGAVRVPAGEGSEDDGGDAASDDGVLGDDEVGGLLLSGSGADGDGSQEG